MTGVKRARTEDSTERESTDVPVQDEDVLNQASSQNSGKYKGYILVQNDKNTKKDKYAVCVLCGKDKKNEYVRKIKMTDSNTKGIRQHLQKHHPQQFNELFGVSVKQKARGTQKTVVNFFQVSLF